MLRTTNGQRHGKIDEVTQESNKEESIKNDKDRGIRVMRKDDQGWVGGKDKTAKA